MKKWLFSAFIVALAAAFAVVLLPGRQVQAACGTILTGSFASAATPQTSPSFSYLVGDIVTATAVDSAGTALNVNAEININGTTYSGSGSNVSITRSATATMNGTGTVFFSNQGGTGGTISWTITISGPNCPGAPLAFTDSRMNPQAWATAVLYCVDDAIQVYDVDNASIGRLLFVVTPEEIAEVGVPSSNTVIDSANGVRGLVAVYRLASGEFQVVAPDTQPGKYYTFTWPGC